MQGVEKDYCNAAIWAVLAAAEELWGSTVDGVLQPRALYGKSDTLGMDAVTEIAITNSLVEYDESVNIATEESCRGRGVRSDHGDPRRSKSIFISDPTDRSAQLKKALGAVIDKTRTVIDVVREPAFRAEWEKNFGGPAAITGSTSAVTCIRRGVPIFAVIANFVTLEIFVACRAGVFVLPLSDKATKVDLDYICGQGQRLYFCGVQPGNERNFVTFLGKSGYRENFLDSRFMGDAEINKFLFYNLPGGPSRALYLSDLQPDKQSIGFILANGEKISEWAHWLPFIRFGRTRTDQGTPALRLYEVFQERPWTKDGVLMSTPPVYSIFVPVSNDDSRMVMDPRRLAGLSNPSRFRSTLIVAPANNRWTASVRQYGFRPIEFFEE